MDYVRHYRHFSSVIDYWRRLPLLTTALGQWWFPWQANGSLIREGDTVRGSALIGQNFTGNGYFHGRPSATAEMPYNPQASGGAIWQSVTRCWINR